MNSRLIFPVTMFALAGCAFAFGGYQYWYARQVAAAADARVAHIMEEVDGLAVAKKSKLELYAAIFEGYPKAPSSVGADLSDIFAAPTTGDACESDGQRMVCRALSESIARDSVCGLCNPLP